MTVPAKTPRTAGSSAVAGAADRADVGAPGRAALVLGNYRAGLTAARKLSQLGYRVILGSEPGAFYVDRSRFVDETWRTPPLVPGSERFREGLFALLDRTPDLRLIMPMHEAALDTIAAMEAELGGRVQLAMPPGRVIEICHDKYEWLKFARDAGVDCPPFGVASDSAGLAALTGRIGYPVVIRPTESGKRIGMRKAVTLFGDDDLASEFAEWPEGLSGLLAQRLFTGDRYNSYFVARDGQILCEQQSRSLRTDRADGTGQTTEGVTIAPIATLSADLEKVVSRMEYTGVGCAQFLFDTTSRKSCFLEINPRFGASYVFIEKAGLELTRLAVELAQEGANPSLSTPYRADEGTRFISTYSDLAGWAYSVAKGEVGPGGALRWLGAAVRAAVRADVHVTWSWGDPLPAIAVPLWRLRRWVGRARPTPRHQPAS